jgi:hypothetical protein
MFAFLVLVTISNPWGVGQPLGSALAGPIKPALRTSPTTPLPSQLSTAPKNTPAVEVPLTAANSKLFPQISGWKIPEVPARYTPEDLFDYIDGAADNYLQFDFEELLTATYVDARKVEVTVDIYRHRDATRAFGIYTQERPAGSKAVAVGIEGIEGPDHLLFVVGTYYVKLVQAGVKANSVLRMFAERIAEKIPGTRKPPTVFDCFPSQGKSPRAEKLIARNFLGYAFLSNATTVPYVIEGTQFRLFAVEGKDPTDVRRMVEHYRTATKAPASETKSQGTITLKDALNGEVLLQWNGRWLWGAVDQPSHQKPFLPCQALVDELGRNLLARMK